MIFNCILDVFAILLEFSEFYLNILFWKAIMLFGFSTQILAYFCGLCSNGNLILKHAWCI